MFAIIGSSDAPTVLWPKEYKADTPNGLALSIDRQKKTILMTNISYYHTKEVEFSPIPGTRAQPDIMTPWTVGISRQVASAMRLPMECPRMKKGKDGGCFE
jgi:hypothetical protein